MVCSPAVVAATSSGKGHSPMRAYRSPKAARKRVPDAATPNDANGIQLPVVADGPRQLGRAPTARASNSAGTQPGWGTGNQTLGSLNGAALKREWLARQLGAAEARIVLHGRSPGSHKP